MCMCMSRGGAVSMRGVSPRDPEAHLRTEDQDADENVTLPQTSFAGGKNKHLLIKKFGFKAS